MSSVTWVISVGVFAAHLQDLLLDDAQELGFIRQDAFIIGHQLGKLMVFSLDLFLLQAGEPGQAHIQYGLGLLIRKAEAGA